MGLLVIIYSISHRTFLSIYYLLSPGILKIETEKEQDELSCHRKLGGRVFYLPFFLIQCIFLLSLYTVSLETN